MGFEQVKHRLCAIMFTDIVGYTAVMARSEAEAMRTRQRHREIVRPLVERYHGEWIEETGDESLSIFPSAVDAANCALAVQSTLRDEPPLQLRVGIHLGETLVEGARVYGEGVNVASRIRPLAEPGQVCITAEVYRSIRNQAEIETVPLGEQNLKNVPEPVTVYSLTGTAAAPGSVAPLETERPRALRRRALVVALAFAAGAAWWLYPTAPDTGPIRSIAVLPLENLSGDPDQEYFADGMTEALIGDLAQIASLRVTSRTSVMRYKGARKPLPEIAAELGVDSVLEGTVMRDGDRVRITAQLIDARRDEHLWAERYDRELVGILALQADVEHAVAKQIRLELAPHLKAQLSGRPAVQPAAQEAYLRGRYFYWKGTHDDTLKAIEYFEEAIRMDPDYARGYAGLADAYS
jgi:adenylate cyclase